MAPLAAHRKCGLIEALLSPPRAPLWWQLLLGVFHAARETSAVSTMTFYLSTGEFLLLLQLPLLLLLI